MTTPEDVFLRANLRFRQRAYQRWHESQLKRQILRSQIGFHETPVSRPVACTGCRFYHGHAYGLQRSQRVTLVCAMHPYGWQAPAPCPDWQGTPTPLSAQDGAVPSEEAGSGQR
ncbi:MAG: hypothetical protein IGR92_17820 [Leptolyngbyaceae cyanobacterium T60_A2020_046]|nr:hypothetical protein [Leptolyngbyaceae cyanobacterium T60_A2020_046]